MPEVDWPEWEVRESLRYFLACVRSVLSSSMARESTCRPSLGRFCGVGVYIYVSICYKKPQWGGGMRTCTDLHLQHFRESQRHLRERCTGRR